MEKKNVPKEPLTAFYSEKPKESDSSKMTADKVMRLVRDDEEHEEIPF